MSIETDKLLTIYSQALAATCEIQKLIDKHLPGTAVAIGLFYLEEIIKTTELKPLAKERKGGSTVDKIYRGGSKMIKILEDVFVCAVFLMAAMALVLIAIEHLPDPVSPW
jgi:hypothetical protein